MKNTVAHIQEIALPKQSHARTIVLASLAVIGVLVASYVYFVGKIVFDVVGRRTAEASIQKSESAIASLQVAYFSDLKNIDIAQASSVGLQESTDTLYAVRPGSKDSTIGMLPRS